MGTKISKQLHPNSSSQGTNPYQSVSRAYAKWDYHAGLVSDDVSRFSTNEIRNLKRHNQASHDSSDQHETYQSCVKEQTLASRSKQLQFPSTKKSSDDLNLNENRSICRSQSDEQVFHSKHFITAEELMRADSQWRRRHRSSQELSEKETILLATKSNKSVSSNDKNKRIPANFQFILINQHDIHVKYL